MQPGVPPVDADPSLALMAAYPAANRRLYRAPLRPQGYDPVDLGLLAVASPYACYLQRVEDGPPGPPRYRWDFEDLKSYACHPGVCSPWAVVDFEPDDTGTALRATHIESALGSIEAGDPEWAAAQRLALCAASTHLTLVRHFNWLHLVCGASVAIATHNCLPARHPVRTLLQPHLFATQFGNEIVTRIALAPGGDFESIFSLSHRGVSALIDATVDEFDFGVIDPDVDAAHRGVQGLAPPSIENRRQHHTVFLAHARRYLACYYDDDDHIGADPAVQSWRAELARRIHGIDQVGGPTTTVDGTARLVAAIIQLATVEHEILGSGMWDYQLWNDAVPARVPVDVASGVPLDVYQRLVNANFNLNVHRTALMSDLSSLALDDAGADAFRAFRSDLLALQGSLDATSPAPWRMEPKRLKLNINACRPTRARTGLRRDPEFAHPTTTTTKH